MLLRKSQLSRLLRPIPASYRKASSFSTSTTSTSTSTSTSSQTKPLTNLLIANRGEIALRVGRTATDYGIRTTTIYTNPDSHSQHALSSPFAINLGDPSAYLDGDLIIKVAKQQGCEGIHPGYGFLSENPTFARKCTEAGLTFIGPPWEAIEAMGSKSRSKDIMTEAGVPCIPGYHGERQEPEYLREKAGEIGYPVLLKAVKGGGGKGMRIVRTEEEFLQQLDSAKSEARNSFGDEVMLVEKYITRPRHIEVQVFADKFGNCVALGERDCSIQRRHQKILEESPAPHLKEEIRQDLWQKARAAALAVGYEGAGTVEFIFDNDTNDFFFMEMNTRLQVEHPVTEMVTGEDLVRWQLIVAEGGELPLTQEQVHERVKSLGHAFEARIYAENPDMNFTPDSGTLLHMRTPPTSSTVRVDSGFISGDEVSSHYDPMIAKLIVRGPTRTAALQKLRAALEEYEVAGPVTNIEFLKRMCVSPDFVAGEVETGYIDKHREELFERKPVPDEVLAQAAIGLLLAEVGTSSLPAQTLIGTQYQEREIHLVELAANGKGEAKPMTVRISQLPNTIINTPSSHFTITINNKTHYTHTTTTTSPSTPTTFTTHFPHTRITTTLIHHPISDKLTLFQHGTQYRLQLAVPTWVEKALGTKDVTNSVLAPMPCKVLRVDVKEGDVVKRDQVLCVIESMKMETVIRAPVDGVVARVVHGVGGMCKAGEALVEFVGEGEDIEKGKE
ncbi:3-methylcrotonyl-CoA carboxylase subunit alpha [Tothia fuscella]|uniref:3-methylcrotonyl-CoA carboxylase subunit alpha n=1 Tax=Tothia fuscella TaxID=1048955 RepID=A0A9P4NSD3_9PEZI|nr:3-methylcrotonyl-CoA carboxylase subunit alpha [Tothia fuscella]